MEEKGGMEARSVALSDPSQGKNGQEGEENKPCILSVTLGGATTHASCSQDQCASIRWDDFGILGADPIHTDSPFTTSSAVLSIAVQVFITEGGSGPRTIAVFSHAACSTRADSAISRAISVLCALHFDTCGVKLTPLVSCESEARSTITSRNDGLTCGGFTAWVVAAAHGFPEAPSIVAEINGGISHIAVFFTLTALIAPRCVAATVQVAFALDGTGILALTIDTETETVPAIRILGAFGLGSTASILNTAYPSHEVGVWTTITAWVDGFADGLLSAVVVAATHGVPFSSAFDTKGHIGASGVFFALSTFSADEVEFTVPVGLTLQGTCVKTLSFHAESKTVSAIRILTAFGLLVRFTGSTL